MNLNSEVRAELARQNRDRLGWTVFGLQLFVLLSAVVYMFTMSTAAMDKLAKDAFVIGVSIGKRDAAKDCGRAI